MRAWYAELVDATITETLATTADNFTSSGRSTCRIVTTVHPYGYPLRYVPAIFNSTDHELTVFTPNLVPKITEVARTLGISPRAIQSINTSADPEQFFGDMFFDKIFELTRRSGRRPNDRTLAKLPRPVQEVLENEFSLYSNLDIPPAIRTHLQAQSGTNSLRGTNEIPSACAVCGPRETRQNFLCQYCARDATIGFETILHHSPEHLEDAVHWAMSQLALEFGGAFSERQTRELPATTLPNWSLYAVARMICHAGPWTWRQRLVDFGITPDGTRPSWGTYSRATDGHWCRSLLERQIDDFFNHRGIPHDTEPHYPHDHHDNPLMRLRADWKLADGTFVEAFGALPKPAYADKAKVKRQLAARHGIPFIELTAVDTHRLDEIFHAHLPID